MKTEWISVKDRFPDDNIGVLITDGESICTAKWVDNYLWTSYGFGGYDWDFDFMESQITYWMPLPEPPKK